MAVTIASLKAVFSADTTDFERGASRVKSGMQNLGGHVEKLGGNMTKMGQSLGTLAAGPALAFGLSIKAAASFESAFAGVRKTVDGTERQFAALEKTLRKMATSAGNPLSSLENAHETLAGIMEVGGQLGVPIEKLQVFTQTIGELGMATNLTGEEAATMTAQFANITGMSFDNVDRFGSALVDLGNNLATNEKQILEFSQRLAGIGSTIGLTETEILALGGSMASLGLNAEAGSTSMTQLFDKMIKAVSAGGTQLQNFGVVSGMTAQQFAQTWRDNPVAALQEFLAGFGQLSEGQQAKALEEMHLSGARLGDTIRRMSGNTQLLTDALNISSTAWEQNTALTEEAAKRAATTEGQWNMLKNNVHDLGITIGSILLPAVNKLIEDAAPLIQKLAAWADAHPDLIQKIATATLVVGGLSAALMILGPIVSAGGVLLTGLMALPGAIAAIGTLATGPVGLLIAGIAAVSLVLDALGVDMGIVADVVKTVFEGALNIAISIVQKLVSEAQKVLQWLGIIQERERAAALSVAQQQALLNSSSRAGQMARFANERFFGGQLGTSSGGGGGSNPFRHSSEDFGANRRTGGQTLATFGRNQTPNADLFNSPQYLGQFARPGFRSDEASQPYTPPGTPATSLPMVGSGNGFAAGTPWTGSGSGIAGVVHGGEAVIPGGGMTARVVPSPGGLMVQGGGGGGNVIISGPIYVQGVEDPEDFHDKLVRIAKDRAGQRLQVTS